MSRKDRRNPQTEEKNEDVLPQDDGAVEADAQPAGAEAAAEAPKEEVNPLQADLDAAKSLADEYLTLAQRVQADFDNYRRRNESVRADSFEEGRRAVAAMMLPVLDNLERALASAPEESALRSGVELTLRQMNDAYTKLGVEAIDCQGQKFDPNLENAVMQGTAEEGEPGTVCMVLQKGYKMGKFVLRHAMVKVVAE